jgi:hypothetical protein
VTIQGESYRQLSRRKEALLKAKSWSLALMW